MKLKCICLLITLLGMHLAASPNRNFCNGLRCDGRQAVRVGDKPATISETDTDESELLPNHYFLNHI